jgi:hypothetical protein
MNVSPVTTTTYSVTVSDGTTSVSGSVTINVTQVPNTSVSITSTPSPACANQAATFTAAGTNGGNNPVYSWYVNGGFTSNGTTYSSSSLTAGTSVYAVLQSSLACANSATSNTLFVSNCGGALTVFVSDPDTLCSGESTTITAQGDGGTGNYTYSWSPSTGLSSTGIANPVASPTAATTYTVTVNDGSNTVTGTVVITVNPSQFADAGTGGTICPGGSIMLNASGGGTYTWSPSTDLSATNIANPVASPTVTTVYTVTVVSNGCTDNDDVTVTVNSSATASVSITSDVDSVCAGEPVIFTANPVNGGTPIYQWMVNGQNVGQNSPTLSSTTLLAGDDVTVQMTSSLNCVTTNVVTSNTITVVNCVGIEEAEWAANLQVYPNPASDRLFITLNTAGNEQLQIELFNIQGQRLYAETTKGNLSNKSIAVDKLAGGVYFLKLTSVKGSVARRIVIE